MIKLKEAAIHGRFQPPHIQHLEYLLEAKRRCHFLWIGLTRFTPYKRVATPFATHREPPSSNPLSYFERVEAITAALNYAGISRSEFEFLPFPIEEPGDLPNFLNPRIPCFTTVVDGWNERKIELLKSLGYKVEVLINRSGAPEAEIVRGTFIRERALAGDPIWKSLIAPGALEVLERLNLPKRLAMLKETEAKEVSWSHSG